MRRSISEFGSFRGDDVLNLTMPGLAICWQLSRLVEAWVAAWWEGWGRGWYGYALWAALQGANPPSPGISGSKRDPRSAEKGL